MSRGRKIVRQSIHSGVFYLFYTGSRVLLALALGKTLSLAEYGSYSLITAFIGLGIAAFSFNAFQYIVREVPGRPSSESASLLKSILLCETILLAAAAGVLCSPLIGDRLARLLGLSAENRFVAWIGLLLIGENTATELMRYLYARKEIEKGNLVSFLQNSLWPIALFWLFLLSPKMLGLPLLLMAWTAGLIGAIGYGLKQTGLKELWRAPFQPKIYRQAVLFGFPMTLTYSVVIANWAGRFMLSGFHSPAVVGVFSYHLNIILMISALSAPLIANPIDPYVTDAYNTGRPQESGLLLSAALRWRILLVLPILLLAVAWEKNLVTLLARPEYASGGRLLALLSPIPILNAFGATYERVLFLQRRTGAIGRCYLIAGLIQILLYGALVPWNPYGGAAAATVAGLLVLVLLMGHQARKADLSIQWGARSFFAEVRTLKEILWRTSFAFSGEVTRMAKQRPLAS